MSETVADASRPPTPPVSQVRTFLIADVRGYTRYTAERGDEAAAALSEAFQLAAREAIERHDGSVLGTRGDEVIAVFTSARMGAVAAMAIQEALNSREDPIPAGIGLDAGEAVQVGLDYRGAALNLAARLCSLARAGEVLTSQGLAHLMGTVPGVTYTDRGLVDLKGFADPIRVMRLSPANSPTEAVQQPVAPRPMPEAGFLGALPIGSMVARRNELSSIREALSTVSNGTGALTLVTGEPGVGKTRLSQAVTIEADSLGFMVITGRCYEPQQAVPYFPFREALTVALAQATSDFQDQARLRWPYLSVLLPDHGFVPPDPAGSSHEEQQRLHAAVAGFLSELAARQPVALLLDDLHWSDGSSLDLLQHLARQTRGFAVFILGTYRDTDVTRDHALQRAVVDLSREHLVHRVRLEALNQADTLELVQLVLDGAQVSSEVGETIFLRTDGNPFFTEELAREMSSAGTLIEHEGSWKLRQRAGMQVPETIRLVIEQRLGRLSPSSQTALTEASVLGPTFSFGELTALTSRDEDDLDEALEEATSAGLVKFLRDERYTFNHSLTQQALQEELSPRRARRLHLRAAEFLSAGGGDMNTRLAAEIAWHFDQAGDSRAYEFAMRAGDGALAVWALRDAKVHYELALKVAEKDGEAKALAVVLEKLGGLLTVLIEYPESLVALGRASDLYASLADQPSRARVEAQIGRVHYGAGITEAGIVRLQEVMPELVEAGDFGVASLHSVLARLLLRSDTIGVHPNLDHYRQAIDESERVLSLNEDDGDAGLRADAHISIGAAQLMLGDWHGGVASIREAIREATPVGDLYNECRGYQLLGSVALARGAFGTTAREWTTALDIARRMGNRRQVGNHLLGSACVAWLQGRESACADEALSIMEELGGFWHPVLGWSGLALWPDAELWSEASESLRRAIALAESPELVEARTRLMALRVSANAASEHARQECHDLREEFAIEPEQGWAIDLVEAGACLSSGDLESAEDLCHAGLEAAETRGLELRAWEWKRILAEIHAARSQSAESSSILTELIAAARQMPYPHGLALLGAR